MTRQPADLGTNGAAFPLLGQLVGTHDALEESAGPHRPSYLEVTEIIGEVEKPVLELDAGHVLTDEHGLTGEFTLWHSPALLRSNTERFGKGHETGSTGKTVTDCEPLIRPTAFGASLLAPRAAVVMPMSRRPTPHNDPLPIPMNDDGEERAA